jgi:hypothetical protein
MAVSLILVVSIARIVVGQKRHELNQYCGSHP